jgi:hypothetical protein
MNMLSIQAVRVGGGEGEVCFSGGLFVVGYGCSCCDSSDLEISSKESFRYFIGQNVMRPMSP